MGRPVAALVLNLAGLIVPFVGWALPTVLPAEQASRWAVPTLRRAHDRASTSLGDGLRVEAKAARDTYYVGQAIEVRVGVVAEGERPRVFAPKVAGAEVSPVDTEFRRGSVSGIGEVVTERNLFLSRFRVVASTPGSLSIPPFRARLGDASGASAPIRLTIRPIPSHGRPSSYLGGVGRFDAKASASASSVRLGQALEYTITLTGPGARGSTRWPDVNIPGGPALRPDRTDLVADPPSRTFRYKVRPAAPGELVIPSVALATFDPALHRYNEARAPGVTVRVVDVPRLDPATIPGLVEPSPTPDWNGALRWVAVGLMAILVVGLANLGAASRRATRPRRWAGRLACELARPEGTDDALADRVAAGMAEYLRLVGVHPGGELTPAEAERGAFAETGDEALAARAASLVARCDRARFGRGPGEDSGASGLAVEATAVFVALSRRHRRAAGKTEGGSRGPA